MVEIALLEISDTEVFAQRRALRIQCERAKVKGNCALCITGLHKSEAEVCECGEVLRPRRNDLLEEGQRITGVIASLQGEGELVFGVNRREVNHQRMTQYGKGRLVLMICAKSPTKLQSILNVLFGKIVCLSKFCDGSGEVALIQEDGAEVIVCGCQLGIQ